MSQRAIARTTGVSRMTIAKLQKKISVPIAQTVTPLTSRPTLELDELWSFVNNKGRKVWIWIALERETRRIVGLAFGDRSSETCVELWNSLPADYRKRAVLYSDFWSAYAEVLPKKRHFAVGKESGQTAHIERFNNTLRQRAGPRGTLLAKSTSPTFRLQKFSCVLLSAAKHLPRLTL